MVQKNNLDKKVLIICGPTASGKTSLAIECAKLLKSEVVSADSMCIYKDLDVGTAKPTIDEQQGIKHHLIDVVSPKDNFSVGDYKSIATPIIEALIEKGKVPVVCGGTGFYINSILYDLSYGNSCANIEVREKYKELARIHGNEYVYDVLKEKDPLSAEKLHYNDVKRVIRALEICESGQKKSDIIDEMIPKYNYHAYAFDFPREDLYSRINQRVDLMIENGLIDEVDRLKRSGITAENQCIQGIGYKEIYSYLNNEISLIEAIELIKLNTRHYAKRQITFFKRFNELKWLKPEPMDIVAKRIINEI
ncbi:MAG: tRNA (adenosine(37)-N6)-dimethylallyltransferase MiaA [Clostridia bacterium]|nr:tRNA (adenosine(37)-N6)-dimethylallyltransferase MiaA [Clostridia bacterium]